MLTDKDLTFKILRLLSGKHSMNFLELMIPLKMEKDPRRLKGLIAIMESEGYLKENRLPTGHVSYSIEPKGSKLLSDKKI